MFLLIDKPKDLTSHNVVFYLRKVTGERKIGHSGTLDPFATGLLIIGLGRDSTKKLGDFLKLDKEYEAEVVLGEERTTDDVTGEARENKFKSKRKPTKKEIIESVQSFVGPQEQVPPYFSAVKIKGKKSYEMARRGDFVDLEARKIVIYSIKLISYSYPSLKIVCKVSSGTYIRSLARDLGRKLKTGAYLSSLRRISIGNFKVSQAVSLKKINPSNWRSFAYRNL